MPFQLSPGVNVSEIDLTTIVPAVSTTTGAIGGVFNWGPVERATLVSTEDQLVSVFGKPTSNNFETFFTAANYLAYGNQLYVSRAASVTNYNAIANQSGTSASSTQVKNIDDYNSQESTLLSSGNSYFVAKYPGTIGNTLKISVCPTANAYTSTITAVLTSNSYGNTAITLSANLGQSFVYLQANNSTNTAQAYATATYYANQLTVGDYLLIGNTTIGTQYVQVANVVDSGVGIVQIGLYGKQSLKSDYLIQANATTTSTTVVQRYWEYFNQVNGAPGQSPYVGSRLTSFGGNTQIQDQIHIVITDQDGVISGVPNQVLEVWPFLSRATDAKGEQGGSIFYGDVLKYSSQWVWPASDFVGKNTTLSLGAASTPSVKTFSFIGGGNDDSSSNIPVSKVMTAYDQFKSSEDIDVSLVLGGKAYGGSGEQVANYILDNIVGFRKDCVAFISPPSTAVVNVPGSELSNLVTFRNLLRSTSYGVLDSGYKYMYDKYNDIYRYVPLNGDVAGLCVRTDNIRDPWFSPAGFNRGQIKNIIKLAYNPNQADRDQLYKNGINPVVNFPGQGVVLFGDKTMLANPSAFDRINVRRLFIILEKAIAIAAKSSLFEFNDEFTRASFRNLVEPYLRDIQGRRGIYDFRVVCDETNNTPQVIDSNQFRGDIYVKPARSINFIQLNFVAVRTGVTFDEIVGKF
jgi:Phage tail sheath protein subtilisin-like domain/Phage tail sheath C-terminal domain